MAVYFISGIDTDAGKSIVTGVIARTLLQKGVHVITQKFIQTGCRYFGRYTETPGNYGDSSSGSR